MFPLKNLARKGLTYLQYQLLHFAPIAVVELLGQFHRGSWYLAWRFQCHSVICSGGSLHDYFDPYL